tara:strand:- start:60 stop:554 length:495 start_codon:yes stop_codon:yes gene_type:complete
MPALISERLLSADLTGDETDRFRQRCGHSRDRYPPLMSNSASKLSFTNERAEPILVWLEPWADELHLSAGSTVKFSASNGKDLGELETAQDQITLWANTDIVQVFIDDALQETSSASIAAPAGLTKSMLHAVFDAQPSARLGGRPLASVSRISIWSKLKQQLGF